MKDRFVYAGALLVIVGALSGAFISEFMARQRAPAPPLLGVYPEPKQPPPAFEPVGALDFTNFRCVPPLEGSGVVGGRVVYDQLVYGWLVKNAYGGDTPAVITGFQVHYAGSGNPPGGDSILKFEREGEVVSRPIGFQYISQRLVGMCTAEREGLPLTAHPFTIHTVHAHPADSEYKIFSGWGPFGEGVRRPDPRRIY